MAGRQTWSPGIRDRELRAEAAGTAGTAGAAGAAGAERGEGRSRKPSSLWGNGSAWRSERTGGARRPRQCTKCIVRPQGNAEYAIAWDVLSARGVIMATLGGEQLPSWLCVVDTSRCRQGTAEESHACPGQATEHASIIGHCTLSRGRSLSRVVDTDMGAFLEGPIAEPGCHQARRHEWPRKCCHEHEPSLPLVEPFGLRSSCRMSMVLVAAAAAAAARSRAKAPKDQPQVVRRGPPTLRPPLRPPGLNGKTSGTSRAHPYHQTSSAHSGDYRPQEGYGRTAQGPA